MTVAADAVSVQGALDDELLALLAAMLRIRLFEEATLELRNRMEIVGSVHLCNGQEAIAVGTCAALAPHDPVFATYRGHGWALACGAPAAAVFGELMGRETGVNRGRGGSAYLSAPEHRFFGENSIVGAGVPIAAGAALAARFDGSDRVAVSVFGDGALNQGSVHEAMNFAAVFDLPVVFVCENNGYSEMTPIVDMVRVGALSDRAAAYGMPGVRVDGNDPVAVRAAVSEACVRARSGGGPTLIEAITERLVGHYSGDAQGYRPDGEVERARAAEPIVRLTAVLEARDIPSARIAAVRAALTKEIETAVAEAQRAPLADIARVRADVYGATA